MNTLEKAELTASIRHIARFLNQDADLQLQSPGYGWQKNEKKEKKNIGN